MPHSLMLGERHQAWVTVEELHELSHTAAGVGA